MAVLEISKLYLSGVMHYHILTGMLFILIIRNCPRHVQRFTFGIKPAQEIQWMHEVILSPVVVREEGAGRSPLVWLKFIVLGRAPVVDITLQ